MKQTGFTLSELLIVLVILVLISIFAVPKLVSSANNTSKTSIIKEAYSAVSSKFYEAVQEGRITQSTGIDAQEQILNDINFTQICPSNCTTEGCYTTPLIGLLNAPQNSAGGILPNGAVICGLNNQGAGIEHNGFIVDYNGASPPNEIGEDAVVMVMCLSATSSSFCSHGQFPNGTGKNMAVHYRDNAFASSEYKEANRTLFLSLFE